MRLTEGESTLLKKNDFDKTSTGRQYVGKCLSWMEAEWEEGQVEKTKSKDFLLPQ